MRLVSNRGIQTVLRATEPFSTLCKLNLSIKVLDGHGYQSHPEIVVTKFTVSHSRRIRNKK